MIRDISKVKFKSMSTELMVQAAIKKGLKVEFVSVRFHLFKLFYKNKFIYIRGTSFAANSQPSCQIANNKFLTKKILRQNHIFTPKSYLVKTAREATAKVLAKNMFPCVLKPTRGAHGNHVFANIENIKEFQSILPYVFDRPGKKDVLLEEFISGKDYRVLVVGDKVSAVTERVPAHIIGDGKNNIRQLISIFNQHPLVGKKYEKPMCRIKLNGEVKRMLGKQNKKLSYVPRAREVVPLRQNANISTGGISKDATDKVSIKLKKTAIKAAKVIGMKITGVDIIEQQKSGRPYVLELNDCPGIDIHHFPVVGKARNVANDIINYLLQTDYSPAINLVIS